MGTCECFLSPPAEIIVVTYILVACEALLVWESDNGSNLEMVKERKSGNAPEDHLKDREGVENAYDEEETQV